MEGDNWSRRVLATALMASAAVTSVECFSAAVPNVAKVGQHSAERSRQWCSASGTANSRSRCPLPFNDRNLVRTVMDASAPPGGEDYDKDRPMRTSSPIGSRSQRMARSFLDEIESGVGASESSFASRSAANEEAGGARENKEPTSRYGRGNASPEAADAAGADKVAERGRQGGPRGQGVPGVGREAADEKALLADGDSNDAELVRDGRASAAAGGLKSTSSKEEGQEVTEGGGVLGAAKGRVAEQGVGVARDTEGGEGGEGGGGGGGGGGGEGEGGEAVQYIPEGGRDARRGGRAEVVEAPTLGGSVGGKQLSGENVPPLGRAAEKEEAARGARPGKKWEVLRKGDEAWGKAGDGHRSSRQRSGSVDDWRGEEDEVGRDDDTAWVSAVRRAGGGGKVQGYGGSRTTGGGASVGGWAAGGEAMEQGEVVASSQGAGGVGQGMAAADWQHRRGQRGQRGQPSEWMKRERSRVKPVGEMELREIARGMGGDAAGRMVEALVVAAIGEMKIPENNGRGPTGRQGWERERRGLNARRGGQ